MLEMIQLAVVFAVACLLLVRLTQTLRDVELRRDWLRVVRGIRWWMLPAVLAAAAATITVLLVLMQVPGLSWGWWSAVGGQGNLLLGQTATGKEGGADGGATPVGSGLLVLGAAIPVLVLALIPLFALLEERQYRSWTSEDPWWRVLLSSLLFGLAHLVVGIPIAAGLALTIAGLTYHLVYRRARNRHLATLASTRPERVLALRAGPEPSAANEFEAENLWFRDKMAAEDHGTFTAASFHALWNLLMVGLLAASVIALLVLA